MSNVKSSVVHTRHAIAPRFIWAVAKREWLTQSRDPKLPLFVSVVALLIPLSVYVNAREYGIHGLRAAELQNRVVEDASIRGGRLTGRDIEQALRVVRTPSHGFMLVRGVQTELSAYWDVGPAGVRIGPPADGYLSSSGETSLDIEFIVRVILGLYPLFLGIEALALERERRTLHALMAHPVSRLTIFGGKVAAAVAILALSSLGVGLLSALAVLLVNDSPAVAPSIIFLLSFATLCYLLSCYLLGLVLSHMSGGFQRVLTIALSVWLFVNVVTLPLAGSVSRAIVEQRPRSDLEGELQRAYDATARESERRLGTELLQRAGRNDWWEIEKDVEARGRVGAALEPIWREYATHWGNDLIAREAHWLSDSRRQERVSAWISLLSPGLAFRRVASHVTGTGSVHGLAWHEAVMNYQATLYTTLFGDRSRLTLRVPTDDGHALMTFQRRPDLTVGELPTFNPPKRAASPRWELFVLPGQCVVLLIVAGALFARIERS